MITGHAKNVLRTVWYQKICDKHHKKRKDHHNHLPNQNILLQIQVAELLKLMFRIGGSVQMMIIRHLRNLVAGIKGRVFPYQNRIGIWGFLFLYWNWVHPDCCHSLLGWRDRREWSMLLEAMKRVLNILNSKVSQGIGEEKEVLETTILFESLQKSQLHLQDSYLGVEEWLDAYKHL